MIRTARVIAFGLFLLSLTGCGKSSKLQALLPQAPDGWKTDGGASNTDTSGLGHSSRRSYVPVNDASGMGVGKVTVQILLAEKNVDQSKLQKMAVLSSPEMKGREEINGHAAFESFPFPDSDHHDLVMAVKPGTWIEIVAYKGGSAWQSADNRKAIVRAFFNKIDLEKVAAIE